ncbi:MAG: phosphoglucomutase/phosphomannomutase alpha/beta/alpha domain [Oscillospiraceae bacterium]|nr:phosphoglucomutase/phosphomannomutase alpha/beta/alpha domain [Oscillospiraceae bacterium]
MTELDLYKSWTSQPLEDDSLAQELAAINGDIDEIKDRFYKELEFGTGGLRGVIGAGTNRMNIYTVRKATQGMADYINEIYDSASVAISFDSRIKSDLFARETARVFAGNGIKVYLYKELMPTPCLSFAVRDLHCQAGVMVTASHNPAKYNGYKAYGEDGCQMTLDAANAVLEKVSKVDTFKGAKLADFDSAVEQGLISLIDDNMLERFLDNVVAQSQNPDAFEKSNLKVVYTPLNGSGNKPVRKMFDRVGIKNVTVVKEQENPDGNFLTCPYPNPEIKETLALGLEESKKNNADLLIATDPDCDRVGIAVLDQNGEYVLISGNEVGMLLLEYICSQRTEKGTMPKNPITVKTIVTSTLIDKIAEYYGVEVINVLTGFKFIGEQIGLLEKKGEQDRYVFGFEESYGYLAGSYVRDKDAVVASMLICEMAAFYKQQGTSILGALKNIYQKYGVYVHTQGNFVCEGEQGMQQMAGIMNDLRQNPPKEIGGLQVTSIADYEKSGKKDLLTGKETPINLPKSDVLAFVLEQNANVVIRPSGTEPKIKAYYTTQAKTEEEAKVLEQKLSSDFTQKLGF